MQRINDLVIRGKHAEVAKLVERIERQGTVADWRRDSNAEARLNPTGDTSSPRAYCFEIVEGPLRPVNLILRQKGKDELQVSSITTKDGKPLSDVEYNRILGDFHANVLIPMSIGINVVAEMRAPRVQMEEYLSPEAMDRLREFVISSSKEEGHAPDWSSWDRFIIGTHLNDDYLPEDVQYWLMGNGFSEKRCDQLISHFLRGSNLLSEYDKERLDR